MKKLFPLLISLLIVSALSGQVFDTLDVNNVNVRINATNVQFCKFSTASNGTENIESFFEFPASSGQNTFYTSGIWLTAKNLNNDMYASADRFSSDKCDFVSGPLNDQGNIHPDSITKYSRVWGISRNEIEDFQQWFNNPSSLPGYTPSAKLLDWPAGTPNHPLAPFVDVNNNLVYDPLNGGDYPDIKGDKAVFVVLNDVGGDQAESGGLPMGMEVQVLYYAFDCPQSDAVNNTIFASYKIINRTQEIYKDFTLSVFADPDISDSYNNHAGTDVANSMMYCYDDDAYDPGGYGDTAVSAGVIILRGPKYDDNQQDDPVNSYHGINGTGFGDGITDNEYFGLTNSIYFKNTTNVPASNPTTDPHIDSEYFYMVRNTWKDMTHLQYGWNGYDSTTVNSRFAFPGDSDPWNASTGFQTPPFATHWIDTMNQPYDCRLLLSSGNDLFMIPGEEMTLDVAYCNAMVEGGTAMQAVTLLRSYADSLHSFFRNQSFPCKPGSPTSYGEKQVDPISIRVFPNPGSDVFTVEVNKNQAYKYRLFNLIGKEIRAAEFRENTSKINLSGLNAGIYLLEITTGNQRIIKKIIKK